MNRWTTILLLILALPMGALAKPFTNSLVFFDSLTITGSTVVVANTDGVGKLPAGKMDTRENIAYAKTNVYRVGDFIRSQGGQHNCYWKLLAITNGSARLHFFGHIRGFGGQDKTFATTGHKKEPQPAPRPVPSKAPADGGP